MSVRGVDADADVLLLWVAVELIRPKCGYNALCHTQTGPLYGWVLPTVSMFPVFRLHAI
jgi:hypothetical protein